MGTIVCEVCGEPAVCACNDWGQTFNEDGTITREPLITHWFCEEHHRNGVCIATFAPNLIARDHV